MNIYDEIYANGIVPVIALDDASKAAGLAHALVKGGIYAAEVTFRTDAAKEVMQEMKKAEPELCVGAGTVLTKANADAAKEAGAKFLVSPGLNPEIVRYAQEIGVPMIPGTNNPSNIETALSLGLTYVKFFPAEQSGGIKMIKAMAAPYGKVKFMPTGGISLNNMMDYLSFDKIYAAGGSFMVTKKLLDEENWDEITKLSKQAVDKMLDYRIVHVGINAANADEARSIAGLFSQSFGFANKEGDASIFSSDSIEIMKANGKGTNGHIAIGTKSVPRAMYRMEKAGVKFDGSSSSRAADGHINFIYLKGEMGGFAVHLKEV